MIKEPFRGMFKVQGETFRKIFSTCNTERIAWQDLLTEEIQDNKVRLYKIDKDIKESQDNKEMSHNLDKETEDLKLSLGACKDIFKKKKNWRSNLIQQKEKHKEDINELSNDNDQPCKRLRDL